MLRSTYLRPSVSGFTSATRRGDDTVSDSRAIHSSFLHLLLTLGGTGGSACPYSAPIIGALLFWAEPSPESKLGREEALETITEANRRLRLMRIPVGAKVSGYIKGWTVEHKTPILGPDEVSFRHTEVNAAPAAFAIFSC